MSDTSFTHRLQPLALAVACACSALAHADDLPSVTVDGAHTASIGPLGKMALLDTPYSVGIVSQTLIADQQLVSVTDALRYLPSVQGDGARPQSRGIQGSVAQNSRIDGMNAVSTTDYAAEQFEQVEVLSGLSGSLYGPANPAGTFNYIQKRPTDQPLRRFTLGYIGQGRFVRGADLSDRIGPDRAFGYRLTLLGDTGTGYTDDSTIRRQLFSLALDYHIAPGTTLEGNITHYRYVAKGLPASFTLGSSSLHFPVALDPTNAAYSAQNGGNNNTTDTGTLRLRHDIDANWHITAGLLRQIADRESTGPTSTISNAAGAYTTAIGTATASRFTTDSNLVSLNGTVQTGGISHDISVGTTGVVLKNFNPLAGATTKLGSASLADPQSFALVGVPDFTRRYESAKAAQQALMLADDVHFSPQWSTLLAASESWLSSENYSLAGKQTSTSSDRGASGSASLVYKPVSNMTTYVTYADSLQQGDTAPAGSSNVNTILAPYRSKEWELGYKVVVGQLNGSLALYQITRPFAYVNGVDNVFRVAGQQRNRGVDLMLDGKVTRDLTLFGGVSWLDPRLHDTLSASTEGKRIVGLPRTTVNLLATYAVPQVAGLSTSLNFHAVDARPTNDSNSSSAAGYATFDLSAAYHTALMGHGATFRIAVDNLADRHYWTNIVPGGLGGYTGAGNSSAQLGAPRTVLASVQVDL